MVAIFIQVISLAVARLLNMRKVIVVPDIVLM